MRQAASYVSSVFYLLRLLGINQHNSVLMLTACYIYENAGSCYEHVTVPSDAKNSRYAETSQTCGILVSQERQHHKLVTCADICQETMPIRGPYTLKLAGVVRFILSIDLGSDNPKNVLSCRGMNKRDPHAHNTCS